MVCDYFNFIESDVYVADYAEDTESMKQTNVFDKRRKISKAELVVLYPFSETHLKEIEWKNDTKYLAEEICKFVQEIYESGEFGYTNHEITDLYLEGIKAMGKGKNAHIVAYIGS